jgi:mannosyl-oligosaccharide alpha-1,2-mannosidase
MKYYDAVARITNELEKWQNHTKLPGMWPISVDASGCKKADRSVAQIEHSKLNGPQDPAPQVPAQALPNRQPLEDDGGSTRQAGNPTAQKSQAETEKKEEVATDEGFSKGKIQNLRAPAELDSERKSGTTQARGVSNDPNSLRKRQLDDSTLNNIAGVVQSANQPAGESHKLEKVDCEHQGLASPPYSQLETFTLGGQSDSTYEYLPKQYMLLGGLQDQYRTMYEKAMDTVRKYLLFRPMTQNRRNVLVAVKARTKGHPDATDDVESDLLTTYESTHLACFAGGMFAIGAKIFGIKGDMDIAWKLADGCVWAYESTQTGIMPEGFEVIPCASTTKCEWNETLWWEHLDPMRKYREQQWEAQETYRQNLAATAPEPTTSPPVTSGANTQFSDDPNRIHTEKDTESSTGTGSGTKIKPDGNVVKRQLDDSSASQNDDPIVKKPVVPDNPTQQEASKTATEELRSDEEPATGFGGDMPLEENKFPKPLFTPPRLPTHEEYVKTRIEEERIPPGFTEITSRKYILRYVYCLVGRWLMHAHGTIQTRSY